MGHNDPRDEKLMAVRFITPRRHRFLIGLLPLVLGACANLSDVPQNTPLAEVEAQFGKPNFSCTTREGTPRVIWTMQPLGQYAWGSNVNDDNTVEEIIPLLTTKNFKKLDEGTWHADDVLCEYGPPALDEPVGLPSVRQQVWSYRYKENGAWNSLLHVYFERGSDKVTKYHSGPDPMFERERFLPF